MPECGTALDRQGWRRPVTSQISEVQDKELKSISVRRPRPGSKRAFPSAPEIGNHPRSVNFPCWGRCPPEIGRYSRSSPLFSLCEPSSVLLAMNTMAHTETCLNQENPSMSSCCEVLSEGVAKAIGAPEDSVSILDRALITWWQHVATMRLLASCSCICQLDRSNGTTPFPLCLAGESPM